MEYILNENGKIYHGCGATLPKGALQVFRWQGTPGEPWVWYEEGTRISDEALIEKGLRQDFRGTYYDQDKQEHEINILDRKPDPSWTTDKWTHVTDTLDTATGKWTENPVKKNEYEQGNLRVRRSLEFSRFDKYQLPMLWESLTQYQKDEYSDWRYSWLDAPDTGIGPARPDWFQE